MQEAREENDRVRERLINGVGGPDIIMMTPFLVFRDELEREEGVVDKQEVFRRYAALSDEQNAVYRARAEEVNKARFPDAPILPSFDPILPIPSLPGKRG